MNKPTAPENGTHHTAAVKKISSETSFPPLPPPSLPLPQSPGSQTRNSLHICIVCLALPATSIVVRRSPERAASSAASWSRSGALSPSTRSVTLSSCFLWEGKWARRARSVEVRWLHTAVGAREPPYRALPWDVSYVLALIHNSQNLIQNKVAPGIPHFSKFSSK